VFVINLVKVYLVAGNSSHNGRLIRIKCRVYELHFVIVEISVSQALKCS